MSSRCYYNAKELASELLSELDAAEIAELGALHNLSCQQCGASQINKGAEAETLAWWKNINRRAKERALSRPTPGGGYLEDYTLASNSWVD